MAGSIMFDVTHVGVCSAEETLARALVSRIKELYPKAPKRISYGGSFGSYICISYNSNALRDVIMRVGSEMGLHEYDFSKSMLLSGS